MKRSRSFLRFRRGSRDANHASIRDGLRALGHFVVDCAGLGDGAPDLLVYPRRFAVSGDGPALWLELKAGKGKLRASQLEWRAKAEARGIRVAVARTLDEALEALR